MKKIALIISVFAVFAMVFSSCSKYEEGPALSLKTKDARVEGDYTVDKVLKNGKEDETLTEEQEGNEYEFTKDGKGTFSASYVIQGITISMDGDLEWKFNDDKTKMSIRIYDETSEEWDDWEEHTILKLTDEEMWLENYDDNDDLIETHYVE